MRDNWVLSLGWEDPQQKGKATHSSILAWRIPWTVHGVQGVSKSPLGSQTVGHDWATFTWGDDERCEGLHQKDKDIQEKYKRPDKRTQALKVPSTFIHTIACKLLRGKMKVLVTFVEFLQN